MRDKILGLLHSPSYRRMSYEQIRDFLLVRSAEDFKEFAKTLNDLEEEHLIMRDKKNFFDLPERLGYYKGTIQVKERGYGFVVVDGHKVEDVFIPKDYINGAMNNDKVFIKAKSSDRPNRSLEGEVVKVISRGTKYIVGTYNVMGDIGFVTPDDRGLNIEILVNRNESMGAMPMHKVRVEITDFLKGNKVAAKVVDIIGHKNDPGVDILSIVYKYDHPTIFSQEVLDQANAIKEEVTEADIVGRVDLRGLDVVTIDGEDAKDLDDAVTVTKLENGNYKLGVYIADVAHYIKEGSPIDVEAFKRGTSVYLADRVIPMIPHRLSNGICSLNPQVNRLVLCCDMEIDKNGNIVNYKIFQGVIKTKERMTYTNVNKVLAGDEEQLKRYEPLVPMFKEMEKLAEILRKRRFGRGAINFETNESKIIVDDEGKAVDIKLRSRGISERIIEEFMLCANETVAEHIHWLKYPFIYRVHEDPNADKLEKFIKLLKTYGHSIKGTANGVHQKELQALLETIEGTPEERAINTLLLRSMMKARYTEQSLGHYGLATKFYTHFTSPIRRYPDTIVHRLLREYEIEGKIDPENIEKWTKLMPEIGMHTSKKERDAVDCERDVDAMKKAEYMEQHIGEEFEGTISSLTNFGMFIELPNTVEGMVHILDMDDDFYEFMPDSMMLLGRRTKKQFRLGDQVKIRVMSASKELSEINFELIGVTKANKRTSSSSRDEKNQRDFNHKKRGKFGKDRADKSKTKNRSKKRWGN